MAKCWSVSKLACFASFFALGVIALGAFTRLIDAGLGCPDWPGCYGHFTVTGAEEAGNHFVAYKAWAEMIHRYFVGGLSLLITVIVASIYLRRRQGVFNYLLATVLLLLLAYQIVLGQWTVTLKLLPIVVTQHLIGGFLILSTLWLIYLNNCAWSDAIYRGQKKHSVMLFFSVIALVLVLLQIILGAWTSTNYASLSCPGFPFCMNQQAFAMHLNEAFKVSTTLGINYDGGVLPEAIRQTIQMSHRFGAAIVTAYLLIFMMIAMPSLKKSYEITKSFYWIFALLCVQLCLGISNVIFKLPLVTAVSHTIIAALLLISVITLVYKLSISRGVA